MFEGRVEIKGLETFLNDYRNCLLNAEQDLLKKQNMITALTSFVACLQKSQHYLITENKNLTVVSMELVNKSKQAQHDTPAARHEKVRISVLMHLLGLAVQVNNNVPSGLPKKSANYNIS